jgi:hypothetical protein
MSASHIQLIAGVLAVIILIVIVMRRKSKNPK